MSGSLSSKWPLFASTWAPLQFSGETGSGSAADRLGSDPASGAGPPDPDEIDRLRSLDPGTITAIHDRYYPRVYRYAHYRISNRADADDIAAEVFIRLLEALHAGGGPRSSLAGWLMGTVSNLVNDYYRGRYRQPMDELPELLPDDRPGLSERVHRAEEQAAVRRAFRELTPDQQNVLALRFGSGYSLKETARIVGKKANAVKQLQFRALAALRRRLEGEW